MGLVRGGSAMMRIRLSGGDFTTASVTVSFSRSIGSTPEVVKRAPGDITMAYNAGTDTTTMELVLSAVDTKNWNRQVFYTIRVDDGTFQGPWIPESGGNGCLTFADSVKEG